jgi:hypothetical protein
VRPGPLVALQDREAAVSTRTIVRCVAALIALAPADSAIAVQRTFVASFGLSANTAFNCSLAKPCRAFSEALGVTSVDGEVVVLDSAGYGPVTITQGVSIIAPAGIYAGVTVSAGDGITINAPGAVVRLRGLSINGQGGNDGIVFQDGARLSIEDCTVTAMGQTGIHVTAVGAFTAISGVVASRNVKYGIGFSGDTRASVIRTRTDSNMLVGIYAEDGATVAITDSEASRNVQAGVHATTTTGTTRVSIDRFTSTGNQSGIDANAPGIGTVTIVDIVRANLSGNLTSGIEMFGPAAGGQVIVSLTDSQVAANGFRGIFMSAPPSPKWSFTMSGNKIINHSGDGILNTGSLGLFLTRQENTISGNTPNVTGALTPLGGL